MKSKVFPHKLCNPTVSHHPMSDGFKAVKLIIRMFVRLTIFGQARRWQIYHRCGEGVLLCTPPPPPPRFLICWSDHYRIMAWGVWNWACWGRDRNTSCLLTCLPVQGEFWNCSTYILWSQLTFVFVMSHFMFSRFLVGLVVLLFAPNICR